MDLSPPFTVIKGGRNKDNLSAMENENSNDLNSIRQMTSGKPPRHLSAMRLCVSSTRLAAAADLVKKKRSKRATEGDFADPPARSRKRSEDGLVVYTEEELECLRKLTNIKELILEESSLHISLLQSIAAFSSLESLKILNCEVKFTQFPEFEIFEHGKKYSQYQLSSNSWTDAFC
ncbi:hypothetical protein Q3G72_029563 [Acer saccharum]|nr:hypothetical protein Q3G72_029563 [Acer saccharum]